ncbi:lytic polysaccharide monooxygenase [Streptomyces sp. YIM B13518]|uniref:lytic polysaccharide monooxygenase n=1 Tax=Streptomyces sp. YIM B13518 TaxID=3366316 RepID=UPI00368F6684
MRGQKRTAGRPRSNDGRRGERARRSRRTARRSSPRSPPAEGGGPDVPDDRAPHRARGGPRGADGSGEPGRGPLARGRRPGGDAGTFRAHPTEPGDDPAKPLTWSDPPEEPFTEVTDPALTDGAHRFRVALPSDRTGRHVRYTVGRSSGAPDTCSSCSDVVSPRKRKEAAAEPARRSPAPPHRLRVPGRRAPPRPAPPGPPPLPPRAPPRPPPSGSFAPLFAGGAAAVLVLAGGAAPAPWPRRRRTGTGGRDRSGSVPSIRFGGGKRPRRTHGSSQCGSIASLHVAVHLTTSGPTGLAPAQRESPVRRTPPAVPSVLSPCSCSAAQRGPHPS